MAEGRRYTYEEMIGKRESDLYKQTVYEVFQKKDLDQAVFEGIKEKIIDNKENFLKIDWKNLKDYMEFPYQEEVEKHE